MKFLCAGMMICDMAVHPVPMNVMTQDLKVVETIKPCTGGDTMNVAHVLKKLGAEQVSLAGMVGDDMFGHFLMDSAQKAGIDTGQVVRNKNIGTATVCNLSDEQGSTHSLCQTAMHNEVDETCFPDEILDDVGVLYFGSALTFPKMDETGLCVLFSKAQDRGILTAMDTCLFDDSEPGQVAFERLYGALQRTDIFIPSQTEAEYLTGETDPVRMAKSMQRFGMKVFGVKLGAQGSFLTDFETEYFISAFHEFPVLDTIGAGDSYMGSFLYGCHLGWEIPQCAALASAVAAFNVAALGATGGVPELATAMEFLKDHPAQIVRQPFGTGRS